MSENFYFKIQTSLENLPVLNDKKFSIIYDNYIVNIDLNKNIKTKCSCNKKNFCIHTDYLINFFYTSYFNNYYPTLCIYNDMNKLLIDYNSIKIDLVYSKSMNQYKIFYFCHNCNNDTTYFLKNNCNHLSYVIKNIYNDYNELKINSINLNKINIF